MLASAKERPVVATLVLEAIHGGAQAGIAVCIGALVRVLSTGNPAQVAGTVTPLPGSAHGPWMLAGLGVVLAIVKGGCSAWLTTDEARSSARLSGEVRSALLEGALRRPVRGPELGQLVRWPEDAQAAAVARRTKLRAEIQLTALIAAAVWLDVVLAVCLCAMLLPFMRLLSTLRGRLRSTVEASLRGAMERVEATRDVLAHAAVWAVSGAGPLVLDRVQRLDGEAVELSVRAALARAWAATSNEVLAAIAVLTLVVIFAPHSGANRPGLISMVILLTAAYRPLRERTEALALLAGTAKPLSVLTSVSGRSEPEPAKFSLATLSVRVRLPVGSAVVQRGVAFEVPPGRPVVLCGEPGCGKTSVLEVILGLREPTEGEIRYGDSVLRAGAIGPKHRPMAWVPPGPTVLPGTLRENLVPDRPDDEARVDRAREVLRDLGDVPLSESPADLRLGPGGRLLSSGEAQRLAIARAIASPCPVLVLDEPSSHLDDTSERALLEVLRAQAPTRVIVLSSHRPAIAIAFERVVLS